MTPTASLSRTVTVISEALSAAPAWGMSTPARAPPAKALDILFSALRREMRDDFIVMKPVDIRIFTRYGKAGLFASQRRLYPKSAEHRVRLSAKAASDISER